MNFYRELAPEDMRVGAFITATQGPEIPTPYQQSNVTIMGPEGMTTPQAPPPKPIRYAKLNGAILRIVAVQYPFLCIDVLYSVSIEKQRFVADLRDGWKFMKIEKKFADRVMAPREPDPLDMPVSQSQYYNDTAKHADNFFNALMSEYRKTE